MSDSEFVWLRTDRAVSIGAGGMQMPYKSYLQAKFYSVKVKRCVHSWDIARDGGNS